MLQQHGPIWIITGDGWLSAHARLLIGIKGLKNDYVHSEFIFVDPADGQIIHQKASKFFTDFEEEAREFLKRNLEFRIQIYHF